MKKIILFIAVALSAGTAGAQYAQQNISLLDHWINPAEPPEPTYGIRYNSVWGWTNPADGKKYGIIGANTGTYIIEVTNPSSIVLRDYVAGRRANTIWREYKNYGKYLYAISDDGAPNSLQIMDMSYLPDSVHVVYDDNALFERAHTLFIDGNKMYCGSVNLVTGASYYSMAVYSLANPELPVFLHTLNSDYPAINYAHDMLVRNDTVYASCGYQGLFIYKYDSVANTFSEINELTSYPDQGYNHSSALSPDGHTLLFADEVPANMAMKCLDIADLNNIIIADTFRSNFGATPHNPYYWGSNRGVIAYYQDGLQIFRLNDPYNVTRTGFFDTDTLHGLNDNFPGTPTYRGCWGAYVNFPNGLILASDMQNGFYTLDASVALGVQEAQITDEHISVFPNPASDYVSVSIALKTSDDVKISLYDITGRILFSEEEHIAAGNTTERIQMTAFSAGTYILRIDGDNIHFSEKILRK
jgi:choice-of-anchor B domain-containing protein